MEVKALFDKFQRNKKLLKHKQASKAETKPSDPLPSKKSLQLKAKGQKNSKSPNVQGVKKDHYPRDRKNTEEGFKIYTEDELRLGDGKVGETPDCPFDCDCCY